MGCADPEYVKGGCGDAAERLEEIVCISYNGLRIPVSSPMAPHSSEHLPQY